MSSVNLSEFRAVIASRCDVDQGAIGAGSETEAFVLFGLAAKLRLMVGTSGHA